DGRLRLVIADPRFVRLLRTVRLDDAFEVLEDLTPAIAGAAGAAGPVAGGGGDAFT
ncbi:anti-sigma factor antagonist, partial [Streptomyces albiflaviniger]|nr:anti-sigma factor antagonist [Streptomyces albiflaviniger]